MILFCYKCASENGWKPTWDVDYGLCDHCGRRSHCTVGTPVFDSVVNQVVPSTMAENIKAIDSWLNKVAV